MFELGIKFLLSYFLGSIMGALTMGKLNGGVDIRNMGSGKAGGRMHCELKARSLLWV